MLIYGFYAAVLILTSCSCAVISTLPHAIFSSEEYLRLILAFATNDLHARLVSRTFKAGFDVACNFELMALDPRSRSLTLIPPSVPVRIPVQIPLLHLLRDLVGKTFIEDWNEILNERYPLITVTNDFDRFADLLSAFNEYHQFYSLTETDSEPWDPKKLLKFYRFLQLSLPGKDFTTEILPSINFPLEILLKHAATGDFPDPINQELLIEYQDFIQPDLVFASFKSSRLDIVRLLLSTPLARKMKNRLDSKSRTILHYAAHFGDLCLVTICLQLGCKVNKFDFKNEKPIHKAAASGHVDVVKFLYQHGAVVNSISVCNPSPIYKAIANNHLDVVNFILNETNFRSNDQSEKTSKSNFKLLSTAIEQNNFEMVNLLISSEKLAIDCVMIGKLLKVAASVENIDQRIESVLSNTSC